MSVFFVEPPNPCSIIHLHKRIRHSISYFDLFHFAFNIPHEYQIYKASQTSQIFLILRTNFFILVFLKNKSFHPHTRKPCKARAKQVCI